jgi:hypothetical protein
VHAALQWAAELRHQGRQIHQGADRQIRQDAGRSRAADRGNLDGRQARRGRLVRRNHQARNGWDAWGAGRRRTDRERRQDVDR